MPLLFFYDGADVYRDQEYLWFLMYSATSKGDVMDTVCPLLAIPTRCAKEKNTQRKIFWIVSDWIRWNCAILELGIGARHGFYGEEWKHGSSQARLAGKLLAGGLKATFAGTTGDFKARAEWNGFTQYYRTTLKKYNKMLMNETSHESKQSKTEITVLQDQSALRIMRSTATDIACECMHDLWRLQPPRSLDEDHGRATFWHQLSEHKNQELMIKLPKTQKEK